MGNKADFMIFKCRLGVGEEQERSKLEARGKILKEMTGIGGHCVGGN